MTEKKIIFIPIAVIVMGLAASFAVFESYVESRSREHFVQEITWMAKLVATVVETDGKDALAFDELAEHASEVLASRVSFFRQDGVLLADSETAVKEHQKNKPQTDLLEVQQAIAEGQGSAIRTNPVSGETWQHIAIRTKDVLSDSDRLGPKGILIVRVSRPNSLIQAALMQYRYDFLLISLTVILVTVLISWGGANAFTNALAREKRLLEQRAAARSEEVSLLHSFGGLLNACSSLEEAASVVTTVMPRLIKGSTGAVAMIKASRNRVDVIGSWGEDWPGLLHFAASECWALRKGYQHSSNEHDIDVPCTHWDAQFHGQATCIPLLAQGETIGVMHCLLPAEAVEEESEDSQRLFDAVAKKIGLILANLQLRQNLHEQAIRDPLTGLYNRRYMVESLDQAMGRAGRNQIPISVLMLDIDHFKRFNDNFGHDAGDYVLGVMGSVLKRATRQEDIACRYGGEEFCVVCPETTTDDARIIAHRILERIRTLELSMNQQNLGTITVSMGVASVPENAHSASDLIKAADEALYYAKRAGRGRVAFFSEILQDADAEESA